MSATQPPSETPSSSWRNQLWLGAGIVALSLFTGLPDSYGLMVRWPWVIVWQLGFVAIAIWTLGRLRQFAIPFRLLGHHLDWAVGLSLVSLTLSSVFAYRSGPAVWYLAMAAGYGVVLYALTNWIGTPENPLEDDPRRGAIADQRRWRLLSWLGLCTLATSTISLIFWWPIRQALPEPINPYPLGHHNFVAGYLVLGLPILITLTYKDKDWRRWLWGIGTGLAIAALYTTGSRGGALGIFSLLAVGLVAWLLNLKTATFPKQKIGWKQTWLQWGITILGGAIALSWVSFTLINPRIQRLIAAPLAGNLDGNVLFRLFTIQAGLDLWRDHPWLGVGLGNTIKLYDLYRPIAAGPFAFRVQQLHSTPAQILAELGLLGLLVYGAWLVLLAALGWRLVRYARNHPCDRRLLYGCGASVFAYGVSSLTDFQLENIGISLTLVCLVAILVSLGQEISPAAVVQSNQIRRYLSLLGFTVLLAALRLWVPVDAGMMLARAGVGDLQRGEVNDFYRQWSTAAKIVPWEPYYPFQLGAQLTQLVKLSGFENSASSSAAEKLAIADPSNIPNITDPTAIAPATNEPLDQPLRYREQILTLAHQHLQTAVELAPEDELFNRYLGALLIDREPEQAVELLRHAAQLTPRKFYTYAMLGSAYLNLKQTPAAVNAFAIEGFVNPAFLTADAWLQPALKDLWQPTIEQTIQLYAQCLAAMSPNQSQYNPIYQNWVMLQWWLEQPSPKADLQRLDPIAQALIRIDAGQTEAALSRLQTQTQPGDQRAALLRAWIAPDRYLPELKPDQFSKALADKQAILAQTIQEHRQIRNWLLSMHGWTSAVSEKLGFFSYRNTNGPDLVELPRSLPINLLVQDLNLFNEVGVLPIFDQTLIAAHQRLLNLDRP